MRLKLVVIAALVIVESFVYATEINGPLGLSWGMTKEQVEKLGVKLNPSSTEGRVEDYTAKRLPNPLPMAEAYVLSFDQTHHLQRVIIFSKGITEDIHGSKGKEKFYLFKESLKKEYGNPTDELEVVARKLWYEGYDFYQCLSHYGCGLWVALFDDRENGQKITLQLKGLGRDGGFIKLTYEGPRWSDVVDAYEVPKSKADDSAY